MDGTEVYGVGSVVGSHTGTIAVGYLLVVAGFGFLLVVEEFPAGSYPVGIL